jgi:diguanylate cyclase (GGDEF)-like protein/putative nucleotidyltransferase with HDIG domain
MPVRTKLQITATILTAILATVWAAHHSAGGWPLCWIYLIAILLSSGFKVALPRGDGSMSLNFPFLLLAIVQLSPLQVLLLTGISIAAQCRVRVTKIFTMAQIGFNVANNMISAGGAYLTYRLLLVHGVSSAPALAIAAVTFFLISTSSVAAIIASSSGESAYKLWRSEFTWYLPFYIVGAVLAALAHWMSARFGWATAILLIPMVYTVYRSYTAQIARVKERQQHLEETEALHLRTIEGLAMAIEAKDQNTHDHLFRVRSYVEEVAKELNLGDDQLQALRTAAFLHDIGKLAVPEHIINKPGKLTPEEFEKMKIHPVVGADILARVRFPYPVVPIVRSHHEWWNGKGYPDGLQGEDIPIGARVLTVVDCFDALVSDRPYRRGMSSEQAIAIVRSMAGTQFDPAVVQVMEKLYVKLEEQVTAAAESKDFTPLNTDIEVWRGIAPGAGFEDGQSAGADSGADSSAKERAHSTVSLDLIAAASQEAQTLFEMSQLLGNSLRLNETISVMASRLRRLIPFDSCALYVRQGERLMPQYVDGECVKAFTSEPVLAGQGISGWVAQSGKPILNGNASLEPNYCSRGAQGVELRSALSVPLFDLQKEVMGVLTLYAVEENSFLRDHLRILQAMESKLSLSLQNALHFRRAEFDAETDFLTELPNARALFVHLETELKRCVESGEPMGIIVCDLNAFKDVNDRYGHLTGNRLLSRVAEALRNVCRDGDRVARMGGDEFVFLMPHTSEKDAKERLQAIAGAVVAASRRVAISTQVSASLGASFYPNDGTTAEELLAVADRRMYLDKQEHYSREGSSELADAMEAIAV